MSGLVVHVGGDKVVVSASSARRFQYIHILPSVHLGQWVEASRVPLGTVLPHWRHVHLAEIRSGWAVNPLEPGHGTPYADHTKSRVLRVLFEDAAGRRLVPSRLRGEVLVIAQAEDEPAFPAPGPWRTMPVRPAYVAWKLTTEAGR